MNAHFHRTPTFDGTLGSCKAGCVHQCFLGKPHLDCPNYLINETAASTQEEASEPAPAQDMSLSAAISRVVKSYEAAGSPDADDPHDLAIPEPPAKPNPHAHSHGHVDRHALMSDARAAAFRRNQLTASSGSVAGAHGVEIRGAPIRPEVRSASPPVAHRAAAAFGKLRATMRDEGAGRDEDAGSEPQFDLPTPSEILAKDVAAMTGYVPAPPAPLKPSPKLSHAKRRLENHIGTSMRNIESLTAERERLTTELETLAHELEQAAEGLEHYRAALGLLHDADPEE